MRTRKNKTEINWRLCFVADSEAVGKRDILKLIRQAAAGGATIIQLRGKTWTDREFLNIARRAAKLLKPKHIPLIINDRVDVALAAGAAGVHLGQDDLPLALARKMTGRHCLIGISVGTPGEAREAERDGANYLGVGSIFSTLSKKNAGSPLGLAGFRRIRQAVSLPLLAIGGIDAANAPDVIRAGADGVAVISAITAARDPRRAAADIRESMENLR
jgi:thiamine-phosphate pyrophosphorylase